MKIISPILLVKIYFCFLIRSSDGAKILAIFPIAAPSHYILGSSLLEALAEAGHDVTMISPYSKASLPRKGTWRDVLLTGLVEEHKNLYKNFSQDTFSSVTEKLPAWKMLGRMWFLGTYMTEKTLAHPSVQNLIKSDEKFDVVIVCQLGNDAVKALATHFRAHLIIFSTVGSNSMWNHLVGNPSLPSFSPELLLNLPPRMSFFQRLENTLFRMIYTGMLHLSVYPSQSKLIRQYVSDTTDINDVLYNASLVLVNSHVSVNTPYPSVPCIVDIGGFHVKPAKKLPEDLQTYLDNAKEGVIYFSLGSNIKSKDLPEKTRKAIVSAFQKLKQKVLWKWEDDVLPDQPPNVKLGKWLPQQDVLAHPNIRAFITHGGLLSTTETIYHGVPILVIPIFGDQGLNANAAKVGGYGVILPFHEITEETFTSAVNEILTNPKYRESAKERSKIMHDRQVHPIDAAVYWVEYVIRHNGAKHLRVPYLDLAWYQYYLLDVFGFSFAVLFGLYLIIRKACSYKRRKGNIKLKSN